MDHHNMRLLWFESFQRHQEQLEATNLLKLQDMEPATRYYVEAKLNEVVPQFVEQYLAGQ